MSCQRCESDRILSVEAKCSDRCWTDMKGYSGHDGYAPHVPGVCGGDYVDITFCLDCGQLQSEFPVEFDADEFFGVEEDNEQKAS